MNLKRLKEAYASVVRLLPKDTGLSLMNQLKELGDSIVELDSFPLTYVNSNVISMPDHWRRWPETLGYADFPYVRDDGLTMFQLEKNGTFYAKFSDGVYVVDKIGRRKFWKYALTGIAYLDRDHKLE